MKWFSKLNLGHPVWTHGTYCSMGTDNPWQNVHCVDVPQSKGGVWVLLIYLNFACMNSFRGFFFLRINAVNDKAHSMDDNTTARKALLSFPDVHLEHMLRHLCIDWPSCHNSLIEFLELHFASWANITRYYCGWGKWIRPKEPWALLVECIFASFLHQLQRFPCLISCSWGSGTSRIAWDGWDAATWVGTPQNILWIRTAV